MITHAFNLAGSLNIVASGFFVVHTIFTALAIFYPECFTPLQMRILFLTGLKEANAKTDAGAEMAKWAKIDSLHALQNNAGFEDDCRIETDADNWQNDRRPTMQRPSTKFNTVFLDESLSSDEDGGTNDDCSAANDDTYLSGDYQMVSFGCPPTESDVEDEIETDNLRSDRPPSGPTKTLFLNSASDEYIDV